MNEKQISVLCVTVDARRHLQGAVEQATSTLARLQADGYSLRHLEIRGTLLRVKRGSDRF